MTRGEPFRELLAPTRDLLPGRRARITQSIPQRATQDQLQRHEGRLLLLRDPVVVDTHAAGVVQPGQSPRLTEEAVPGRAAGGFGQEALERHHAIQGRIESTGDDPHSASPKISEQEVAALEERACAQGAAREEISLLVTQAEGAEDLPGAESRDSSSLQVYEVLAMQEPVADGLDEDVVWIQGTPSL